MSGILFKHQQGTNSFISITLYKFMQGKKVILLQGLRILWLCWTL